MRNLLNKLMDSKNITFIIFVVLALSLSWSTAQVIEKNYNLQQEISELREEVADLEIENQNLKLSISYYSSDTFLELEAREKFNKAAPGEKVLYLENDGDGPLIEEPPTEEEIEQESKPQYQKNLDTWREFFFGRSN